MESLPNTSGIVALHHPGKQPRPYRLQSLEGSHHTCIAVQILGWSWVCLTSFESPPSSWEREKLPTLPIVLGYISLESSSTWLCLSSSLSITLSGLISSIKATTSVLTNINQPTRPHRHHAINSIFELFRCVSTLLTLVLLLLSLPLLVSVWGYWAFTLLMLSSPFHHHHQTPTIVQYRSLHRNICPRRTFRCWPWCSSWPQCHCQ